MMKRFFAVLLAAALLLTLAACANSMGNAVSDAGRGVGNAVSNVGEGAGDLVSGVADGAGNLVSGAGEGISNGASRMGDSLAGSGNNSRTTSQMDRNDGAVRDENGRIGDEDYEEAHNGVESFVESHQNRDASDLTD